jgi:hypothetical protein
MSVHQMQQVQLVYMSMHRMQQAQLVLHVRASNATSPNCLHVHASNGYGCRDEREGETPVHYSVYSFNMNQLQKYTPFTVLIWACLLELDQYIYLMDDD